MKIGLLNHQYGVSAQALLEWAVLEERLEGNTEAWFGSDAYMRAARADRWMREVFHIPLTRRLLGQPVSVLRGVLPLGITTESCVRSFVRYMNGVRKGFPVDGRIERRMEELLREKAGVERSECDYWAVMPVKQKVSKEHLISFWTIRFKRGGDRFAVQVDANTEVGTYCRFFLVGDNNRFNRMELRIFRERWRALALRPLNVEGLAKYMK